jgi:hypothetical protein
MWPNLHTSRFSPAALAERDAATGYLLQQLLFVWWIGIPGNSRRPSSRRLGGVGAGTLQGRDSDRSGSSHRPAGGSDRAAEQADKYPDQQIEKLPRKYPEIALLRTVPGVGPVVAAAYAFTLDRADAVADNRQAGAFLGLRPRQSQSGD